MLVWNHHGLLCWKIPLIINIITIKRKKIGLVGDVTNGIRAHVENSGTVCLKRGKLFCYDKKVNNFSFFCE